MTTEKPTLPEYLKPLAPSLKWWVVGLVAGLLIIWQAIFHSFFMDLPMVTGHRLNAIVGAVLVAGVTLAFFQLIQGYERQLAEAAQEYLERNERLRALEAGRDTRLLQLSQELALAIADILWRCEEARGLPKFCDPAETLAGVEERLHGLQTVVQAMVELREESKGLTEKVPAILEEYERYRRQHPPRELKLTEKEWDAIRRAAERRAVPVTEESARP